MCWKKKKNEKKNKKYNFYSEFSLGHHLDTNNDDNNNNNNNNNNQCDKDQLNIYIFNVTSMRNTKCNISFSSF